MRYDNADQKGAVRKRITVAEKPHLALRNRNTSLLFPEEIQNQGNEDGQQDAGGKGKIEREIVPLDGNVSRQAAEPGNLVGKEQDYPEERHQAAGNDENLAHAAHGVPSRVAAGFG
jgi:hypothetical protein